MEESLEALLEKATNPRNRYEDWEFIMGFCDLVNTDLQGPQVALRIIVPKIRSENEKVAMLSLALLEACVKNCGQKFHQELGKFKFLNELIRLLSPKYLGDTTPVVVKDRVKELLYSWKVGLPNETKINEAYLMLKREGLIFDENVSADLTLQPDQIKPKVSLVQDPKQSQMLQKLLASKNPEDLRAANRLIRDMVRRDEKRMQKLQNRLEEVELIQNNVKLLNELLIHLKEDSGAQEKLLIEELYKSIDKMRPNLFRMASELKQNEEGMADILRTNDTVLRVMDLYKSKMGEDNLPTSNLDEEEAGRVASSSAALLAGSASSSGIPLGEMAVTNSSELEEENGTAGVGAGDNGGATGGGDILIDLGDLNFDTSPMMSGSGAVGGGGGGGVSMDLNSSLGLGSLMDDLSALDLGTPTSSGANLNGAFFTGGAAQPWGQQSPVLAQQQQQQPPLPQVMGFPAVGSTMRATPLVSTPFSGGGGGGGSSNIFNSSSQHLIGSNTQFPPLIIPPPPQQQAVNSMAQTQTASPHQAPVVGMGMAGSGGGSGIAGLGNGFLGMGPPQPSPPSPLSAQSPPVQPPLSQQDPLAILNDMFVPLLNIKPGSLPPMSVMSKDNVAITFHFAENSPSAGVSVVIISIISTSPLPISNFQFQAAVPKVIRVKLQPPTTTDLVAYNPVLPPPSISQVMLLANPSKAKIRMKYRISYSQGGSEVVEMGEASNFPVSL